MEYFQDRYKVVAVDLFGHGQSSKNVDPVFSLRLDAEAIVDLMQNEIKIPYIAIGFSLASCILPEIIKLDDRLLRGVVLVDCTYQGFYDIAESRTKFGQNMLTLSDKALPVNAEQWYISLIGDTSPECRELILSSFRKSNHRWMFQSVAGCREYNKKYPPDKTPIRDNLPILIIEAGHGVGAEFRKSWVNHFKDAQYYLFEEAHHFFYITEHERFNKLLEAVSYTHLTLPTN